METETLINIVALCNLLVSSPLLINYVLMDKEDNYKDNISLLKS